MDYGYRNIKIQFENAYNLSLSLCLSCIFFALEYIVQENCSTFAHIYLNNGNKNENISTGCRDDAAND